MRTLTGRLKGKPCAECSQLIVLGAKVEVDDSEDPPPGVRPFLLMNAALCVPLALHPTAAVPIVPLELYC